MQPDNQDNYWQANPEGDNPNPADSAPEAADNQATQSSNEAAEADFQPLQWRASEYVHHDKQTIWFVGLACIALVLVLVAIFLIHSYTFAVLVVVMAVAVGYMGGRPPHELTYRLTAQGLTIDNKFFSYHDFSSFGILNEGPLYSIILTPVKRFMPAVNIYFPENMGEQIVDILGVILPMQEVKPDAMDKLSRRLRF